MNYYNDNDPYCAQWLRNLIAAGLLPAGEVDERPIQSVAADDLRQFRQCHFFAGIGGWTLALQMAGWPVDREVWTGSCPCQPFSVAGQGKGEDDSRHLWPDFFGLIESRKPTIIFGEQVAAAVGKNWLDGVFADLEGVGYACEAAVVPACAVNAPHRRDRLWFVGDAGGVGREGQRAGRDVDQAYGDDARRAVAGTGDTSTLADAGGGRFGESDWRQSQQSRRAEIISSSYSSHVADSDIIVGGQGYSLDSRRDKGSDAIARPRFSGDHWSDAGTVIGHDGKARRIEPSIRLLADGVSARVGKLRALGNAIVPQVAAEFIGAYLESCVSVAP